MYKIVAKDGAARAGILTIGKKKLRTPFFMPVATKAAIKCLTPDQLGETGTQCVISNGFILSLRPGAATVRDHGGIHKFMNWNGGVFTDSGGFQVLLDDFFVKHDPNGVVFKNPFTGEKSVFTPEKATQIQNDIGSDVAMAFDDVPKYGATKESVFKSIERTNVWAARSLAYHRANKTKTNKHQLMFGIAQGNTYADLREESARRISQIDFDGFAIGGVAIGEPVEDLYMAMRVQTGILPVDKPRYVMGLGSPTELLDAIGMGVDMFDSIFPTQSARRGTLFTINGPLRVTNAAYASSTDPIERGCDCYTCKHYSRAYIRMLLNTYEYIGLTLATIHNIRFVQRLFENARTAIQKKSYAVFVENFKKTYKHTRGSQYFQYNRD